MLVSYALTHKLGRLGGFAFCDFLNSGGMKFVFCGGRRRRRGLVSVFGRVS